MVNATEMAKPFSKQPIDWLKTEQSKAFISVFAELKNFSSADLVRVTRGGNDKKLQGTWMHEDVALEFARWLSPAFAIWCNDRIKELLTNGYTTTGNAQKDFDSVLDSITRKDLAKMLYESEVEKEKLQKTVRVQEKQIRDLRMRINSGENIPERVTHLEQLVLPGFDSTSQNFTPKPQTIEPVEGRIKPSKAKTRYPGALLVYEMRARLQREKGITLRAKDIFAWLNREKWLLTSDSVYNMPSDMAVNQGWILPTWGTGRQESNKTFYTPRLTEKGYQYFLECIRQNGGIL